MKFRIYETNFDNEVTNKNDYKFNNQQDADRYCNRLAEENEGYFYSAECIDIELNTYLITHPTVGIIALVKCNNDLVIKEFEFIYQNLCNVLFNFKIELNKVIPIDKDLKIWKLIER